MPDTPISPIEVLRTAAADARQENADLVDVVDAVSVTVAICHRQTGEQRTVPRAALPFFTSQGYELVDEPVDQPTPDPETPGRHEASEPADAADDPGASTTPIPTSKEN